MSTEASIFALKNALNEIKNVCPEVSSAFIFRENGEVVAEDQTTHPEAIKNTQIAFRALAEKAGVIGGVDSVTFRGEKARASIIQLQGFYVANVASAGADERTISNLTRVMIPATLRLIQEIYPSQQKSGSQSFNSAVQKVREEPAPAEVSLGQPEPEFSELKVENLGFGSFLRDADQANLDAALIAQWEETYGDEQPITQVTLENPDSGKTLSIPFKAFRESKYEGKGLVLLSDKLQTALRVQRGAKILVKPIIGDKGRSPETEADMKKPQQTAETANHTSYSSNALGVSSKYTPDAPVSQFMVENLGSLGSFGLRGNAEFVRVDRAVIARWTELFGDKKIEKVIVEETSTGRRLTCDFKPIKDSSLEGKGIIQLPEKMQTTLQTKKGALITVKPVVE
jgi:hypothetical protein